MRDFFKYVFTRYETKSMIVFLVCIGVIFTTAWSVQEGQLMIQPILYSIGVFALFLIIAFFAYEKLLHDGDVHLEYDDDVRLPEVGEHITYAGDEYRVTRVDKGKRDVFAILV
jgi:hypothetical protein